MNYFRVFDILVVWLASCYCYKKWHKLAAEMCGTSGQFLIMSSAL